MKKQIACLAVFLAVLAEPVHAAEIKVVKVTIIKIVAEDLFSPTFEIQLSWRPGGWITNAIPMQKGESVHPKGMQPELPGSTGQPRAVLKDGMTQEDLAKVTPTLDRKGDRQLSP